MTATGASESRFSATTALKTGHSSSLAAFPEEPHEEKQLVKSKLVFN
jgi:hypothetical protein